MKADAPRPAVIVVEDDPGMRKAVERMLRIAGYDPLVFGSAEELLVLPELPPVQCMVLDVQLPGLDGFALYERLERRGAAPPVVFVTAWEEPGTRARAAAGGGREFLAKPYTGSTLLATLARLRGLAADETRGA